MMLKKILLISLFFQGFISFASNSTLFNALDIAAFLPKKPAPGPKITHFTQASSNEYSSVGSLLVGQFDTTGNPVFTETFVTPKDGAMPILIKGSLNTITIAMVSSQKKAYYETVFNRDVLAKIPKSVITEGLYVRLDFDASKKNAMVVLADDKDVMYASCIINNVPYQLQNYEVGINYIDKTQTIKNHETDPLSIFNKSSSRSVKIIASGVSQKESKLKSPFKQASANQFTVVSGFLEGKFTSDDALFTKSFVSSKIKNLISTQVDALSYIIVSMIGTNKDAYYVVIFDQEVLSKIPKSVIAEGLYVRFLMQHDEKKATVVLADANDNIYASCVFNNVEYYLENYNIAVNQQNSTDRSVPGQSFGQNWLTTKQSTEIKANSVGYLKPHHKLVNKKHKASREKSHFTEASNISIVQATGGENFSHGNPSFNESIVTPKVSNRISVSLDSLEYIIVSIYSQSPQGYYLAEFDQKVISKIPKSVIEAGLYVRFDINADQKTIGVLLVDSNDVIYATCLIDGVEYQPQSYNIAINQPTSFTKQTQSVTFGQNGIGLYGSKAQSVLITAKGIAPHEKIQKAPVKNLLQIAGATELIDIGLNLTAIEGSQYSEIQLGEIFFNFRQLFRGEDLTNGFYIKIHTTTQDIADSQYVKGQQIAYICLYDASGNIVVAAKQYLFNRRNNQPITNPLMTFDVACETNSKPYSLARTPISNAVFVVPSGSSIQSLKLPLPTLDASMPVTSLPVKTVGSGKQLLLMGGEFNGEQLGGTGEYANRKFSDRFNIVDEMPFIVDLIYPGTLNKGIYFAATSKSNKAEGGFAYQGQQVTTFGLYDSNKNPLGIVRKNLFDHGDTSIPIMNAPTSYQFVCQIGQQGNNFSVVNVPFSNAVHIIS